MRRALLPLLAWVAMEAFAFSRAESLNAHRDALLAAYVAWLNANGPWAALAVILAGSCVFGLVSWLLLKSVAKAFRFLNVGLRHG
jgi:hypothetical protein